MTREEVMELIKDLNDDQKRLLLDYVRYLGQKNKQGAREPSGNEEQP